MKKLSARKADKEGHCAIAVADALFRATIGVRFMRRGEPQDVCVDKVLNCIFEEQGQMNVNGVLVAADRGFGKIAAIQKLAHMGIHILFVFPEHLLKCHPFVGESFLIPGAREREEVEWNESPRECQNEQQVQSEESESEHSEQPADGRPHNNTY